MPALKIGVQLASLRLPLKKALPAAARLGASAVEIDARGEIKAQELSDTAVRQLRRMLDDLNLRVCAVGFQTRRGYDVPEELERRVAATKAAMKFAHAIGAAVVINQVGRVPQKPEGPNWDLLVQSLTDLAAYGQRVGALLAAQTGTESGADLARLLAALPPQAVGVNLDPAGLLINGHSPIEAVHQLGPNILHVHARDAVRDARGQGVEVSLSRGSVDFPALLGALSEQNYRGYFSVVRYNADDPLTEIGQAIEYLKSL